MDSPAGPRPLNGRSPIESASEQIDRYYDGLLYEGMPMSEARAVEKDRERAHQEMAKALIDEVTRGFLPMR